MKEIVKKQLQKVQMHFDALQAYKDFIDEMAFGFTPDEFHKLSVAQKGVLEAYLKRFSSVQDYLGAKVFKSLLEIAGISYSKMSEVIFLIEKEGIIDFDKWIEFRDVRNELEHDYPDELEDTLRGLKYCVDSFSQIEEIVKRVFDFSKSYL